MGIAGNIARLARQPGLIGEYAGWLVSTAATGGKPFRTLTDGIKIGDLANFSEYHFVAHFVTTAERNLFKSASVHSGDVIDIGANVGVTSLLLSKLMPERTIYALEPSPTTFSALNANIRRNGTSNVMCEQIAVADANGTVSFNADPLSRGTASISTGPDRHNIEIPSTTLDSFATKHGITQVALIKVDVEGFETLVFRGATHVLTNIRPAIIYFEVDCERTERAGFPPLAPAQLLIDSGYDLSRFDASGKLVPVEIGRDLPEQTENWVATPR